jgi:hypothetical protein
LTLLAEIVPVAGNQKEDDRKIQRAVIFLDNCVFS